MKKRRSSSALVACALVTMLSASHAGAQSSEIVALAKGEPAPAAGIWLSRDAYDEILSEAEANTPRAAALRSAQDLIAEYRERIADLEDRLGRNVWQQRACFVAVGTLGGLYAHQLGRNQSSVPPGAER